MPKLRYRHVVAVLIMTTTAMAYFSRMNLSTAIIVMVKHSTTTTTTTTAKKFDWNEKTKGVILGSFFYGYFALQLISGRLAEIFGPRFLCTVGLVTTAIINLATPFLVEYYGWFIASRVVMGALQAGIFPSAFALASRWIPDNERSTVISMAYIGGNIGTILASAISGYLCEHGFAGGWPSVFYVTGIIVSIVSIIYVIMITNDPENHWLISKKEALYIKNNIHHDDVGKQKPQVPWLHLVKSPVIWTGTFSQFTTMWALTMMMLKLPDYMHKVLKISPEKTGFFGSALYASESLTLFFGGIAADAIIQRNNNKKTTIRKIFQGIASFGSAICLVFIPSIDANVNIFLIVMIISMISIGLQSGGIIPLPSDLTNEFTATVFGLFNMIAMVNGFVCPYVIGWILDSVQNPTNQQLKHQWSIIWYFTAALRVSGGVLFILFGSAKRQKWDSLHLNKEQCDREEEF